MHNKALKEEAIKLRKLGASLKALQDHPKFEDVPRSTLADWIRGIPLTVSRTGENIRNGTLAAMASTRFQKDRANAYDQGVLEYPKLKEDPTFESFLQMTNAGSKEKDRLAASSQDPKLMLEALNWLKRFTDKTQYWLQINPSDDPIERALYWATALGVPVAEIRTVINKRTRTPKGIMSLRVYSTALKARATAWFTLSLNECV